MLPVKMCCLNEQLSINQAFGIRWQSANKLPSAYYTKPPSERPLQPILRHSKPNLAYWVT